MPPMIKLNVFLSDLTKIILVKSSKYNVSRVVKILVFKILLTLK